ncbi:MAG TPA: MFS transporter, partial [Chloroflexota bacterium]|nr:MFS transporter [Chloroflexota bacterium]
DSMRPSAASIRALADSAPRHPLAEPAFRSLWSANIISNVGIWMQTVGGAWLMTMLTADALPVALMQTATTLPAFLVGLPAGSLADRVDRRKLLLATQTWVLGCMALLAVLSLLDLVNPWVLLGLTFAIGAGSTINGPTWAALLPDIVSRGQVPTAIIMNSAGFNIARAVGPSIAGFVLGIWGPAATFVLNAAGFGVALGLVARFLRPRPRPEPKDMEPFARGMLTGLQYAWRSVPQRIVLGRSVTWMVCASALWGLLPLVARRELGLEATGYGFLVTCVGAGAVAGSFALPRLRRRWHVNALLLVAIVIFATMLLVLAWVRWLPPIWAMLALGGAAWTGTNQNFQIAVQMSAPGYVRARAIATYLLTFQGGLAIGSAIWGAVAERLGAPAALTIAACGLAVAFVSAVRWPIEHHS